MYLTLYVLLRACSISYNLLKVFLCVWQKFYGIWSSKRRWVFSVEECRQSGWEGQPHYSPSRSHVPASPLDLKCRRAFRWWEWNPHTCYTQVRQTLRNENSLSIYPLWCCFLNSMVSFFPPWNTKWEFLKNPHTALIHMDAGLLDYFYILL